jgi:hypothetical protein
MLSLRILDFVIKYKEQQFQFLQILQKDLEEVETKNFFSLSVAKGSLYEFKTQLIIAFEIGYINEGEYDKLKNDSEEIGKLITGLMNYLNKSELKGVKYK